MSKDILFITINKAVGDTWKGDIKQNYELYIAHWFTTAENIADQFEKDGLILTAKAVRDIIVESKWILKYDNKQK